MEHHQNLPLCDHNVTSLADTQMGQWSYSYDALDRLYTATATAGTYNGLTLTEAYDVFGNRLSQTPSGTYGGVVPQPSPVTFNGGKNRVDQWGYDAAGDVVNDGTNMYQYDAEGRQTGTLNSTSGLTGYIYDAEGRRAMKIQVNGFGTPHATTTIQNEYLLGLDGEQVTVLDGSSNWQWTNVYAGGKQLATYDLVGTHFALTDWLGSKRVEVNVSGPSAVTMGEQCLSLPYGDGLDCTGADSNHLHFTGKQRDTESGNDYFGARYYGSNIAGRFMSPDPLGGHLEDPQTLNKYVYVRNGPLILTDPTGMDFAVTGCDPSDALHCQRNNDTGQYQAGSYGYNSSGKLSFTAVQVGNYGADGSLADKNTGEAFSGSFDESGIHLTSASGNISGEGQFINGSNSTTLSGSGIFQGFTGVFNDNCGGTCVASGSLFGTQFATLKTQLLHNPGTDAVDFFHGTFFGLGPQNYRYGNSTGPDPHIVSRAGTEHQGYDQFHYDGTYPYATVPGFFGHAGSVFQSIGHIFTGPHELTEPTTIP